MPSLSVALIVKNEAAWIVDCLASVRPVADQLVVVDTGSTDGTQDLARACGAEVHAFPWIDDFAAARNESLRHCTGDWVLVLDADEELDSGSYERLRACMAQDEVHAFRVRILNYFLSAKYTSLDSVTRPNDQSHPKAAQFGLVADFHGLRLFRRHPWAQFQGRIHELVDDAFTDRGMAIERAPIDLHHFGKTLPEREDYKRNYYLDLARKDLQEHPNALQARFNLLLQGLVAQDWATAWEAADGYTKLTREVPPMLLYGGGVALQQLNRNLEALAWFDNLLQAQPDHAAAWNRRAVSLAALGRIPEARQDLQRSIALGPSAALAYLNLAELESGLGNLAASREALELGLSRIPEEETLWVPLVMLGLREQSLALASRDALRALQAVPHGGQGLWHRLGVLGLLEQGAQEPARALLLKGMAAFPQDAELQGMARRLGLA